MTPAPTSWSAPRRRLRAHDACAALTGLAIALVASVAALGCDRRPPVPAPIAPPTHALAPTVVPPTSAPAPSLCITEGHVVPAGESARIREPATRGVLAGSTGNAATLAFTYRGASRSVAALASGAVREQLGLKLRAQDSCNVIYVMWRIEPTSEIVVQVKRNPAHAHRECGNDGYVRVRPALRARLPALGVPEDAAAPLAHELRAEIAGDDLSVFADGRLVWRGALPASARELRGPAGFRTDNVDVDLALEAPRADLAATCPTDGQ